jgi:predicted ABC-type ATPase
VLIFIGRDSADLLRGRVMERVEAGGHDVPHEKIVTRFPRTFTNLRQALSFVNYALQFDNRSADETYRFVAEFRDGKRGRRKGYHPVWAGSWIEQRHSGGSVWRLILPRYGAVTANHAREN